MWQFHNYERTNYFIEPQTVNNENKAEYMNLIIKFKLVDRIKSQMTAFIDGFNEILPTEQLKEFDANELELLMCGLGKWDAFIPVN